MTPALPAAAPSFDPEPASRLLAQLGQRNLVLVGMMGAGKSSIGKRLAERLGMRFVDADAEIEAAAGQTIPEIFTEHGEPYFREGEKRVIGRLLDERGLVIATGGGAFMNADTRAHIARRGVSIWLKADVDVLMHRVRKRSNRPLLKTADPEATMRGLMEVRHPVYALAEATVQSREVAHEVIVAEIIEALMRVPALAGQTSVGQTSVDQSLVGQAFPGQGAANGAGPL
jgi:shikimate kinase